MNIVITIKSAENGYQIEVNPYHKPLFNINASTEAEVHAQVQAALTKVLPVPKRTPQELEAAADALEKEADTAEKLMHKSDLSATERQNSEAYIAAHRVKAAAMRKEASTPSE